MGLFERKTYFSRCAALLSLLLAFAPGSVFAQQQYALLTPSAIMELTNSERREAALVQYKENPMLTAAAEEKAQDMATRSYFAHATPEGEKTWNLVRENGYAFSRVGENLAVKFSDPSRVVSMWLASPGHRANILNEKFVDIGVGIAEGAYQGATTTFVVALFAAPLNAANEPVGEVKGEQEPSQESAGLMASLEPETSGSSEVLVKVDESKVVAPEVVPQQAAAASAGRPDSFRDTITHIFEFMGSLFRQLLVM